MLHASAFIILRRRTFFPCNRIIQQVNTVPLSITTELVTSLSHRQRALICTYHPQKRLLKERDQPQIALVREPRISMITKSRFIALGRIRLNPDHNHALVPINDSVSSANLATSRLQPRLPLPSTTFATRMETKEERSRPRKQPGAPQTAYSSARPSARHQRRPFSSSSSARGEDETDNHGLNHRLVATVKKPQELQRDEHSQPHVLGPKAREALVKRATHTTDDQGQQTAYQQRPRPERQPKVPRQEDRLSATEGQHRVIPPRGHQFQTRSGGNTAAPHSQRPPRKQVSDRWKASAWSKAGISTTVLLRDRSTRRTLLFDCGGMGGVSPTVMAEAETVFISHAHADHCGGLFAHARSRFAASHVAKYLVPKESLEQMKIAKAAFEEMDGHELKMDFLGVQPGMILDIGKGLTVECVSTEHRVPSVGFLIYRTEKRIKPEYADLPPEEKAELGRMGIRLSEAVRVLEIAYSGDTTAQGLDPRMFKAQLSIIECTFVTDKEARLARETQHVLLSELEQVIASCEPDPNCQLLLMHFSARYSASQITAAVRGAKLLPKRTALALAAFNFDPGATDEDAGIGFA